MEKSRNIVAVDLGAESGRVMLVSLFDGNFKTEEVHRFTNSPLKILGNLHWDVFGLFKEIKNGLSLCSQKTKHLDSIGIDTWGVDFGLLDSDGALIGQPFHYRDARTDGMLDTAFSLVSKEEIFERTGIQFMQLNSLYQLLAMKESPLIDIAHTFLMMPDLLNYWLSGEKVCEFTDATTTQMYDQRAKGWAVDILQRMGLPDDIYPQVIPPGTHIGELVSTVADELNIQPIPVIAPACHDTGSAIAAVPVRDENFAYISSGTWSLVGVETLEPIINAQSLDYNFTNEGGVAGTVRLLKNVTGLWLIQECRRSWAQEGKLYSYDDLAQMAARSEPFVAFVDPDALDFLHPEDMPKAIQAFCARTGQVIPITREAILRCIFESLALKYRYVLDCLQILTGASIDIVHVIGGGSRNEFLNQLTSDASGKPVIAGPVEATALGNAIVQAVTLGTFDSVQQARVALAKKMPLKEFYPRGNRTWEEVYQRFQSLLLS